MKKFLVLVSAHCSLLLLPAVAAAAPQPGAAQAEAFVDKLNTIILFPTITLLSAVAFLVFLWGTAQYFFNAANDQARQQGVKHITWGIIGLVVMLSAFTILALVANTFGLTDELDCANDPTACGKNPFVVPGGSGSGTVGTGSGNTGP